jgi:WD40 repeat protein
MSRPILSTTPVQEFKGHEERVNAVAIFPDKRRMVTASNDKTLRLWDLKTGTVLRKMEGHSYGVSVLAVSRDGQIIISSDGSREVITWHGETGEKLPYFDKHDEYFRSKLRPGNILSLDFSPDGKVVAIGSTDLTLKLWCTKTWQLLGSPIHFRNYVRHVWYSPSGELLAIATNDLEIYNSSNRECIAKLKCYTAHIAWTPDGARLLSICNDHAIREWDTLTWRQVGDPWALGHTGYIINSLAIDPSGTHIASGSSDSIRLGRLSDRQTVAILQQSSASLIFLDSKYILSGSFDTDNNSVTKWAVNPTDTLQEEGAYINAAILLLLFSLSLFLLRHSPVDFLPLHPLISRKGALPKDPPENKVTNDVSWR